MNNSAVDLINKDQKVGAPAVRLEGFVPTGWYPTRVLLNQGQVVVLSAKGIRPRCQIEAELRLSRSPASVSRCQVNHFVYN